MSRYLSIAVLAVTLMALAPPVLAERLVSTLSNTSVQITSSFAGETLTMFGNIEDVSGSDPQTPYHVIIVIEGPRADRVTRRKTNVAGIWLNTEQVTFEGFPSYFHVISSGRLTSITSAATLAIENLLPEAQSGVSAKAGWWKSVVFGNELVRLMTESGFFGISEGAVQFLSPTTYSAQVVLPHDVPNGPFLAKTYVFKSGKVVATASEGFSVRKTGFERLVYIESLQQPVLYGIVCVTLAIFTGWLGGVVFRR